MKKLSETSNYCKNLKEIKKIQKMNYRNKLFIYKMKIHIIKI